ncbi:hypothetical protein ASL14_11275 [Paenibacillus sp. IHB B 3084]|uniref:hypothetical protein n=1 Tax=unclassified Paenibacillus TaxID=185978 RepID=UPI00072157EF|nr:MULTISPECIES: hypothetical protein [unclassified Paenibacillus]ALP36651.1 hypothetical protein ASL14_11275 [Paenibacillus sp. IHB B 3084]MBE0338998.1 hypothetical protein [Paenibacillus sp. 23TSA30-6]
MSDEIKQYQSEIEELQAKVSSLEQSLKKLAILVEPNPKYPYWHKILCLGINEEQRMNLEYIMSYLTSRLHQDEEFLQHDAEQSSRFPPELFRKEKPSADETINIIIASCGIGYEKIVKDILICMYQQGMFKQIISFLFPVETSNVQKVEE